MTKSKTFFSFLISFSLIAGFVAGFTIGSVYGGLFINLNQGQDDYAKGWLDARKRLIDSGYILTDVRSFHGKIVEINGNKILFESDLINPLDPVYMRNRIAIITDKTSFVERTPAGVESAITLSDLGIGHEIIVESDGNVADMRSFRSSKIVRPAAIGQVNGVMEVVEEIVPADEETVAEGLPEQENDASKE